MKAYKINAYENKIEIVGIPPNDLNAMYKAIGCSCFCVGTTLPNGDTLWVDDEGCLNYNVTRGFMFDDNFFAGNGLILGCNHAGDSVSVKSELTTLHNLVKFAPPGFTISDEMRDKACKWTITTF